MALICKYQIHNQVFKQPLSEREFIAGGTVEDSDLVGAGLIVVWNIFDGWLEDVWMEFGLFGTYYTRMFLGSMRIKNVP